MGKSSLDSRGEANAKCFGFISMAFFFGRFHDNLLLAHLNDYAPDGRYFLRAGIHPRFVVPSMAGI